MTTTSLPSPEVAPAPAAAPARTTFVHRVVRGRPADPAWVRPALLMLLAATAVLYLWDLGASGWGNSFYAAAVQAGTKSWKAFFFGSSDAANSITVDKPPASLWVMEISARIFGVNSWSILVPQALEGVAAVGLLYATVRRWFSAPAGLIAGAVMALTPSAVLMFRFDNPDALLVLLLVAAAYALTRAIDDARAGWLVLAGALVGFGFLSKMLQAFLVVPGFGVAYLLAARATLRVRVKNLVLAASAMVAAAGWWVAIVTLTPAADRPYIGGSQHNSVVELILGYNGFGRLTGNETGSVTGGAAAGAGPGAGGPGGAGGGSMWGKTGWTRLFGSDMGTQVSWLLPAALILLASLSWLAWRTRRRPLFAFVLVWGGWLLVTGATFSLAKGIIHPYYTVALAPALGALVGVGAVESWRHRDAWTPRALLAAAVVATAWWAERLLARTPSFHSWLGPALLVAGIAVGGALLLPPGIVRRSMAAVTAVGVASVVIGAAAPFAYALDTASAPHTGSIPTAGPATGGRGGPGVGGAGFAPGGRTQGGNGRPGGAPQNGSPNLAPPTGQAGGFPGGGATGQPGGLTGQRATGGLLDASTPSAALVAALQADAGSYTWVAATIGSNSASGYQLASGEPVMPIGGFNGSDPFPTLAQFEKYVAAKEIHYFIAGGIGASNGGSQDASQIAQWVAANFTATTIGGTTVYDLSGGTS
jgi:4-amino-4-deoxy-L-arabinose transferase-like glycosyltransferase